MDLLARWRRAQPAARTAPGWIEQLVLAADQFVVRRPLATDPDGLSVIAGYPWFGDWGRGTMIALPGLTLATGRPEVGRRILTTFARFVDGGMLPNRFPDAGEAPEYDTVDAALWYVEAVRAYHAATDDDALLAEVFPALEAIVHGYREGTRYGIGEDPSDGLVRAGEPGVQLTWMDAKVGERVITPRTGKPVEINALRYNALRAMAAFASKLGRLARVFESHAARARRLRPLRERACRLLLRRPRRPRRARRHDPSESDLRRVARREPARAGPGVTHAVAGDRPGRAWAVAPPCECATGRVRLPRHDSALDTALRLSIDSIRRSGLRHAHEVRMGYQARKTDYDAEVALVASLRDGDLGALQALMVRYGDRVLRLAHGICRNEADAEEVTQDVFLTVFRKIGSFEGKSALWTWLFRITTNTALMKRRGKRFEVEVSLDRYLPTWRADGHRAGERSFVLRDWSQSPEADLLCGEVREVLHRAIDTLPPDYRAVLVLRDVEGLSNEEVADIVDETVACVKSRLHRARMVLRELLTARLGSRQ